jgi:hypothetical protein
MRKHARDAAASVDEAADANSVIVPMLQPASVEGADRTARQRQSHIAAAMAARPGKVKRAKSLIADPAYPSPEVLKAIAETLAQHIRR